MLCVAVNLEDLPGILQIVAENENIFASAGIHPNHTIPDELEVDEEILAKQADRVGVVAVGETGLDYFQRRIELAAGTLQAAYPRGPEGVQAVSGSLQGCRRRHDVYLVRGRSSGRRRGNALFLRRLENSEAGA